MAFLDKFVLLTALVAIFAPCYVHGKCEPIQLELCRDIGYNLTSMPNLIDHETQEDAAVSLETFRPLIKIGCSARLRIFLCAVHAPMCTDKVETPIGPCRNLCNAVRSKCLPVLEQFGYTWPVALNCSRFPPENNDMHMCMEGPRTSPAMEADFDHDDVADNDVVDIVPVPQVPQVPVSSANDHQVLPCSEFRHPKSFVFVNRTGNCAQVCEAPVAFAPEDRNFAELWMGIWASVCALSTFLTVVTFFMDPSAFPYPERPIVTLSACYLMVAAGHLLRVVVGYRQVACHLTSISLTAEEMVLLRDGLGPSNVGCAVVFLLTYYFGMASAAWWVILTFLWARWANRTLENTQQQQQQQQPNTAVKTIKPQLLRGGPLAAGQYTPAYHFLGWGLPAAFTVAVIISNHVDADPLTGLCYVGTQDGTSSLAYVLAPQAVLLVVGLAQLAIGGCLALKRRRRMRLGNAGQQGTALASQVAESVLTVRMGCFCVLYILPAFCVLGCQFYEYFNRDSWLLATPKDTRLPASELPHPNVEVFMLKIFMSLVIGITAALWTWSGSGGQMLAIWRQRLPCKWWWQGRGGNKPVQQAAYAAGTQSVQIPPQMHQQQLQQRVASHVEHLQLQQRLLPPPPPPPPPPSVILQPPPAPAPTPLPSATLAWQQSLRRQTPSRVSSHHPYASLHPGSTHLPPHLPHEAELLMGADRGVVSPFRGSTLRVATPGVAFGGKRRHPTDSTTIV